MALGLRVSLAMKHTNLQSKSIFMIVILTVFAGIMPLSVAAGSRSSGQTKVVKVPPLTKEEKALLTPFNRKVKEYVALRERARKQLPPLSKDSTPEQIAAYQKRFVEALRVARANAKPSYIFSPTVADYFRTKIKTEFKGNDRAELRETILEADTAGVPLKVNYPYPETKELTQIPPTLLLKLPELPKELKYRFVKRHMLLVDTDNGLIVDYMLNALP